MDRGLTAIAVLLLVEATCAAETLSCAGSTLRFDFSPTLASPTGVEATVTVSRGSKSTVLRYATSIDFIGAECRLTPRGKSLIVFQAYCGGSACRDLDNFGIVDPSYLRVLLVPNDWNRRDAARIVGGEVKPIENMTSLRSATESLRVR